MIIYDLPVFSIYISHFFTPHYHCALNDKLRLWGVAGLYGTVKAKTMNLYKVSFLIVFLAAAYVDGDFLKTKTGKKFYFNMQSCS